MSLLPMPLVLSSPKWRVDRMLSAACIVAATGLVAGCSLEEEGDIPTTLSQSIENGTPTPYALNAGTVYISILPADGVPPSVGCSGQVVSRDTILTAAHCIYNQGYYAGGWNEAVEVSVKIQHQNPDGSWDDLTPSWQWTTATAFVQETLVDLRDENENDLAVGWDIALIQTPSALSNIDSDDAAAFSRYTNRQPEWLMTYGHGWYTDYDYDGDLRLGFVNDLIWNRDDSTDQFMSITNNSGGSDANICLGDSGGPWKTHDITAGHPAGVLFAVNSRGWGSGNCGETGTRAPMIAYHDLWMREVVEDGLGSCSTVAKYVLGYTGSYAVISVPSILCW